MSPLDYVESPCVSVCEVDAETGFCKGCWRTQDEVAGWARADDATRLDILERLHKRREAAGGAKRRRATRRRAAADGER